ncbi:glycosyltransferase family 87 protein [Mariniblastus fucicola]|uniref:DUF2029 domain-containing protein n=1 Tax=Mariniblastus fucicola TaxID=980251 RepID=A0A5B9P4D2_9BACT|nr:glycosyltransferase family 87 protein [Mariniblastus fucicola]QEG20349.1 hypothetical protein MFFC18_01960 [Mariniblastus fucicola]
MPDTICPATMALGASTYFNWHGMSEPTGVDQTSDRFADLWMSLRSVGAIRALVVLAILFNCYSAFSYLSHRHDQQDFAHYYVSSKLWLEGKDVYGVELTPLYEQLGWNDLKEPVFGATNPPPLLVLFAPFAVLNPQVAHVAWMLAQILAFVFATWLAWKCVRDEAEAGGFLFVLAIFLFLPFLKSHFYYSQVQLILMAMVLFAYQLLPESGTGQSLIGRSGIETNNLAKGSAARFKARFGGALSCAIVSLAALIKIYPLVLLPWFVWRSDSAVRGRITSGLTSVMVLAIGVWLTDVALWQSFAEHGLRIVSAWVRAAHDCYTFANAAHQLGTTISGDADSNLYVRIGSLVGALVLAAFYLRLIFSPAVPGRKNLLAEFSLLILLMLFCGGTCWWHYLVFLLLPMQVIASRMRDHLTLTALIVACVVIFLLANLKLPTANLEILKPVLNQRPLIAMLVMAVFLAFNLKSSRHAVVAER